MKTRSGEFAVGLFYTRKQYNHSKREEEAGKINKTLMLFCCMKNRFHERKKERTKEKDFSIE